MRTHDTDAVPDGLVDMPVDQHGRPHFEDALLVVGLVMAAPVVWAFGQSSLLRVVAALPETLAIGAGLVAVFIIGRRFYAFRSRARRWYGVLEVVVGLVAAVDGIRGVRALGVAGLTLGDGRTSLLTLAGAVYLVVRGLDSWHHGGPVSLFHRIPCPECAREAQERGA